MLRCLCWRVFEKLVDLSQSSFVVGMLVLDMRALGVARGEEERNSGISKEAGYTESGLAGASCQEDSHGERSRMSEWCFH